MPSTINDFKIGVSQEPDGPWEDLVPIPLAAVNLYWVGVQKDTQIEPKIIRMANGTYRIGSPSLKQEDLRWAVHALAQPVLESQLANPIAPHTPVSGWVALDSRRHVGLPPGGGYYRITLRDSENRSGKHVTPIPTSSQVDPHVDSGGILITGNVTDISKFHVKYYSDPFPRPEELKK